MHVYAMTEYNMLLVRVRLKVLLTRLTQVFICMCCEFRVRLKVLLTRLTSGVYMHVSREWLGLG